MMFGLKDKRLSILDRFFATPVGQELLAQEAEEIDGQRKHAAEVMATVERERAQTLPRLAKATANARLALARAKQAVVEAEREYQLAELCELDAHNRFERELGSSRSFLAESAPECIQSYLSELVQYYSDIRRVSTVLPELKGSDVPGSMTAGHEQRKRLNERWEHTLQAQEFHQLVRDTITLVKQMFAQPLTPEQAAKDIDAHRRCIAKAQKAAGIILN